MNPLRDPLSRRELLIVGGTAVITAALAPEAHGQIKEDAPKAGEVSIAWYGQSMFQVVTPKGTRLLLDPQDIEAHKVPYVTGDLLLMTHFHTDHTTTPKVENVATIKQYNALKKTGPGPTNTEWNPVDEKFKDIRFQSLGTYHDDAGGSKRGKNGAWILDIEPG
ncbi:MAG: MBL fold metallo-hydrolase, partial [Gemmataceae bacterium]